VVGNVFALMEGGRARALFNAGLEHMKAGRFAEACPAIEESYGLDPRPGTLFTLAECEAQRGRLATALASYTGYLALYDAFPPAKKSQQRERAQIARAQVEELGRVVPTLILTLPPGAPSGTVVMRYGVIIPEAALGIAIPGEAQRATPAPSPPPTPPISTAPPPPAAPPSAPPMQAMPPAPPRGPLAGGPSSPPADTGPTGRRVAAYTIGSIGIAGLAIGTIMGALAVSRKGTVRDNCDGPACNSTRLKASEELKRFELIRRGSARGSGGVVMAVLSRQVGQ
jgi:hypothetical protein